MKGPPRSCVICSGILNQVIHDARSIDEHVAAVSSCIDVRSFHLADLSVMMKRYRSVVLGL